MINKGPLLILLGSVCFSFSGTFQQFAPIGATPFTITEARMLIGAAALLFWCLLSGKFNGSFAGLRWKYLILMAVSLLSFQLLFFSSILKTGVAVGSSRLTLMRSARYPAAASSSSEAPGIVFT